MKKINYKYTSIFVLLILVISFFGYQSLGAKGTKDDLFQKAVDKNFKQVDEEIKQELKKRKDNKKECFGPNKEKPVEKCADELEKDFDIAGKYAEKYYKACQKSLKETVEKQDDQSIGNKDSLTVLDPYMGACAMLYTQKLGLYKQVAYNILKRNKVQVLTDELKKMQQQEKKKNGKIAEHLKENTQYLRTAERGLNPSFTPNHWEG